MKILTRIRIVKSWHFLYVKGKIEIYWKNIERNKSLNWKNSLEKIKTYIGREQRYLYQEYVIVRKLKDFGGERGKIWQEYWREKRRMKVNENDLRKKLAVKAIGELSSLYEEEEKSNWKVIYVFQLCWLE